MLSIDKLKSNSSAGPDGYPPIMYKVQTFVQTFETLSERATCNAV